MEFIDRKAIKNLDTYRYSGVDKSLVAKYILQPYWSRLVLLFPTWMAPNLITLLGLGFILANILTLLYYSPTLEADCPTWVYYSFAVGLFCYTSLDAIDGKQARRTNSSSPLGELFDHGCDALNTVLGTILTVHTVNVQNTWLNILYIYVALSYFYVSTWETYHTGTLYLGYINGPVEGTLMVCLIYVFTGYVGRAFWLQPVVNLVGTELGGLLTGMRVNEASTVAFAAITLLMMTSSFYNMLAFAFRTRANVFAMYGNLFPIVAIVAGSGAWLWATRAPIITGHILALTLALGLEFCMSVARIIVAHLTHTSFPVWQPGLAFLLAMPVVSTASHYGVISVSPQAELYLLYFYLGATLSYYCVLIVSVINQLCEYLGIYCLTLKRPLTKTA